jgi:serine/threonine-protein kinase
MAEVWEARLDGPVGFAKRVAIKRLMAGLSEEQQFVNLFLDEARLMAGLTHPHICQVLELGETNGSYWVAMEFLAGHTAYQLIRETVKRGWRVPIELAVLIAKDTAEALAYAHAKQDEFGKSLGIIHRDVSPQNVMVTYEGVVKLVDFGIAKAATRTVVTESGQMRGKMSYMPPEQARGEELDPRADQFALGATLFELVTQTRLYGSLKDMDLFREVATKNDPLPRARSRHLDVPPELDDLIARMIERDREKRFPSMAEVQRALSDYLTANTPSVPTDEALSRYMTSCFPPESRPVFTTSNSGPFFPQPTTGNSLVRAAEKDRRPLMVVGAVLLALLGGALVLFQPWKTAPPVAENPVTPPPKVEAPAGVPDAAVALVSPALVEPTGQPDAGDDSLDLTPIQPGKPVQKAKPGFLSLQTTPWTIVFLGKRNLGETPLSNLALPPGRHRLRLTNDEKKLSTTIEVEIKSGQTTTKRLKF